MCSVSWTQRCRGPPVALLSGMNLSAPFIIQVPPFKVVQLKMMLNDDVFFGNVTLAATFTGTEAREEKDVESIVKKLNALGKNGRKAMFALPKEKLVDTNGAGDVYKWISCLVVQEKCNALLCS